MYDDDIERISPLDWFCEYRFFQLTQLGGFLLSESVDATILKAFLVFIAYTNMREKGKENEIEAKELLQKISGLFVHDS